MHPGTPKTMRQAITEGARLVGLDIPDHGIVWIEATIEDFIRQKMTVVTLKYDDRTIAAAVNELMIMLFSKTTDT